MLHYFLIFGFVISCFIIPPMGPIVYLIVLIIFMAVSKILKISTSTSAHALKTVADKTSEMPTWLPLALGIPLFLGFNAYFSYLGADESMAILSFFLSCVIIYLVNCIYKRYLRTAYNKFLYSAIEEHFDTLSAKYKELVYVGDYGETIYDKWYKEIERFIDGVIKKQKSGITLPDEELKKYIIKIFDEINIQHLEQK